mgnify:CR=1 FL=1
MGKYASTSDISSFLAQAKKLISEGNYVFVPRRKNLAALANYGLTITDAKDEILDLMVTDYYKGPKQDFDKTQPGDIWEFKKIVDDEQFYVKLKIQNIDGKNILKCLSFHEDEYSC